MRNPSARIAEQQRARLAQQQIPSDGENSDGASEDELDGLDNIQPQPARRGPTKMKKISDLPEGKRLNVSANGFNQFCCQDATTFANYLGSLVRNGEEVPLTYMNWRHVPLTIKKRLWELVQLKWNVSDRYKDQAMKSFGKKLREFRHNLKKKHYDKHDNYDARIADRDSRVKPEHWRFLVEYWDTEEFQAKSEKSKANRAQQTITHCAGSKSFARFAEELRIENDRNPTRTEVFVITHCDQKGRPMNPETAEVLSKMDELCKDQPELAQRDMKDGDLYGEVFGKEKNGHVRGLGLGPAPSDVWGDGSTRAKSLRMAEEAKEAKQKAEEAQRRLEEERQVAREQNIAIMAQLAEETKEAKQKAEEAQRRLEEERQVAREENIAIMAQLAAMQEKMDRLEKEKHGEHQNNSPQLAAMQEKIDRLEKEKHGEHQNKSPQLAAMQEKIDRLEKEKHGEHQNNSPHMPIPDEREFNYNQNDMNDSASSAASHQMQSHNVPVRNITNKRTYNLAPQTIQKQKEFSNKDLRRIKHQKSAPYMADKKDRLAAKKRANRPETTAFEVQDKSRYVMCSISRNRAVAEGYIMSDNPEDVVGGQMLGPQFVELIVDKVIAPDEPLIRPFGKSRCLKDVSFTAWPKSLVSYVLTAHTN